MVLSVRHADLQNHPELFSADRDGYRDNALPRREPLSVVYRYRPLLAGESIIAEAQE